MTDTVTNALPPTPPARSWAQMTRESLLTPSSVTEDAIREAADRGVGIFVRQSRYDAEASGSRALQIESSLDQARVLGAARGKVFVVTAWGERASPGAERPKYGSVRALIRERLIGILVVPEHHRLSRTLLDAEQLFQEAAAAGVLLHIAGRTYNPGNPSDLYILEVLAGHAQYENATRARWGLGSKLKRAEQGQLRLPLPAGLVWVAENDAEYFERAAKAGLGAWITDLDVRHLTDVRTRGPGRDLSTAGAADEASRDAPDTRPRQYILPFPDEAVVRAVALRVRWALDTGSVEAVAERIRAGDGGWPTGHARQVPYHTCGSIYQAGTEASWRSVDVRKLKRWLRSPALYGVYSAYYDALLPPSKRRHQAARRKGLHYGRLVSQRGMPLPDASALLAPSVSEPPHVVGEAHRRTGGARRAEGSPA